MTDGGQLRCGRNGIARLEMAAVSCRADGDSASITYAIADSRFGRILVAAKERGVCWLGIHHNELHLASELTRDFPRALTSRNDHAMKGLTAHIVSYISGDCATLEIPLDIRATPFQLAVWRELCAIPAGATRSYAEIAERLGRPRAARAVGRANGANPLALVIPCHRAVGSDGRLTGYRWGLEIKRQLLEYERRAPAASA